MHTLGCDVKLRPGRLLQILRLFLGKRIPQKLNENSFSFMDYYVFTMLFENTEYKLRYLVIILAQCSKLAMMVLHLNVAQKPCHSSLLAMPPSIYEYTIVLYTISLEYYSCSAIMACQSMIFQAFYQAAPTIHQSVFSNPER